MSTAIDRQDGLSSSTAFKGPCRVATSSNIVLEGLQTIDGLSVAANDRVLVRAQTDGRQNGIWVVDTGLWRRSADFKRTDDVISGTRVGIVAGSTYANSTFALATSDPIYVDTTSLTFDLIETNIAAGFVAVDDSAALAALTPTAGAAIVLEGGIAVWTLGDFSAEIAATNPLYVKQSGVSASIGAWVYQTFTTPPVIDRTRPLVYQDFYRWKGNDHNAAMSAIFDAMFESSADLFRSHVDLQGARIVLEEPVVPTGGGDNYWHMSNGRFLASSGSWAGNYMIDFQSAAGQINFRFVECEFDGVSLANWIISDAVALLVSGCTFQNNKLDLTPGLYMKDAAHIKMYDGCRVSCDDVNTNPNSRMRVGLKCENGDQKIYDSIFNYFKYSIVMDGFGMMMANCHIYQGTQALLTGHTAGIKFTNGRAGAVMTNVYLDKCFVELSNELHTDENTLGGLVAHGIHTALNTDDTGFAFYVARDYGSFTDCSVSDVVITAGEYRNQNATDINLTQLYNPTHFDPSLNDRIIVNSNKFYPNVSPQASSAKQRRTVSSASSFTFDFSAQLPFGSEIQSARVFTKRTSGTPAIVEVTGINTSTDVVTVASSVAWAGSLEVEVNVNKPDGDDFVH